MKTVSILITLLLAQIFTGCGTDLKRPSDFGVWIWVDEKYDGPIKIKTSSALKQQIEDALIFLKHKSPEDYDRVNKNIKVIQQAKIWPDQFKTLRANLAILKLGIVAAEIDADFFSIQSLLTTAAGLIHETCHLENPELTMQWWKPDGEIECYSQQIIFMKKYARTYQEVSELNICIGNLNDLKRLKFQLDNKARLETLDKLNNMP